MPDAIIADARQLVDLTADIRNLARRIASRAAKEVLPASSQRARIAARLLHARARRTALLPDVVLGEPCWDMLLDLYVAHAERRTVTVSGLCRASRVPDSTALRAVGRLVSAGYVDRHPDPEDRRMVLTQLTAKGRAALDAWLDDASVLGLIG